MIKKFKVISFYTIIVFLTVSTLPTSVSAACKINGKKKIEDICSKFQKSRWKTENLLGKGSFGTVFSVKDKKNEFENIALKKMKAKSNSLRAFSKEIQIGKCFNNHPQLLSIYECYYTTNSSKSIQDIYLINEKMESSLTDIIFQNRLKRKQRSNYESWKVKAMIQMAKGLKEMHDMGMVHLDLKPDNIMVGYGNTHKNAEVKLVDFGLSTNIREGQDLKGMVGTPYFMAPEITDNKGYGKPADIYALGIVFYLFLRNEDVRLVYSMQQRKLSLLIFDYIEKFRGLIQAMVNPNPKYRPDIDKVLDGLFKIQQKEDSGFRRKKIVVNMSDLERCVMTMQLNQEYSQKNRRFLVFSGKTVSGQNCNSIIQMAQRNGTYNRLMSMIQQNQGPQMDWGYYQNKKKKKNSPGWAFKNRILLV